MPNANLVLNMPRETIRRCLQTNDTKPLESKVCTLQEDDAEKRLQYCL